MEIQGYKIHPLAQKVPEMTVSEYRQLKESLQATGQTSPILTHNEEIIDGRHRLKACLELSFKPWIKAYEGDKPIAQFILSTNIRRNLSSAQMDAMIIALGREVLPQLQEEAEQAKKNGSSKGGAAKVFHGGGTPSEATQELHTNKRFRKLVTHPRKADYTIAVLKYDDLANKVESGEMSLDQANQAAVERNKAKRKTKATPKKEKHETYIQRVIRTAEICRPTKPPLTREQVDPDFKGTNQDWVDQYGHVQIRTKAQMEIDRDQDAFTAWVAGIRSLRVPLRDYLAIGKFTVERYHAWMKKASNQEKRLAEVKELASLIVQTRESVNWLLPLLEPQKTNGDHP